MKSKFILLVLSILFSVNVWSFNQAKMDSLFMLIESKDKGMGAVSVFQDGKEVYQNTYGYSDRENNKKPDATTKYRIGSITKTFTVAVIMKLIENGKLSLATKLSEFYPQVPNADKITMEHLLRHRSGISNFTDSPDYLTWNTNKYSKDQLLEKIVSGVSIFEPNSQMSYSNSNYVLLTFIAEDISGKKYAELLQEMIIQPLGLKNTFLGQKINTANNEALSYAKLSDWKLESETDLSIPLGAGAIVSTPTDLNIFFTSLFNGRIVKKESLEQMKTLKDNWGLGIFQVPFYDKKGYGHTGGIDGFRSSSFYFPDEKTMVSITSNGADFPLNDILIGILSIYWDKDYQLPEFKEGIALKTEDLDKYLGVYSAPNFPIKLTISKEGNLLIAQGTGQPSFPLECFAENQFKFDQARLELEFFPEENKLILKQGGGIFELKKE